jgi:hypothetical protein
MPLIPGISRHLTKVSVFAPNTIPPRKQKNSYGKIGNKSLREAIRFLNAVPWASEKISGEPRPDAVGLYRLGYLIYVDLDSNERNLVDCPTKP